MFLCGLAFSRGQQKPLAGLRVCSRIGVDAVAIASLADSFGPETVLWLNRNSG